jgi:hypothetical protein
MAPCGSNRALEFFARRFAARCIELQLVGRPDVVAGKYFGMNESCYIARGTIGAYCAIGARTSINPFSHPIDWLSTNEFQYHPSSFDWVEEYRDFERLQRTADMYRIVTVGNDVWTGRHVHIMGGVTVGDDDRVGLHGDEGPATLRDRRRPARHRQGAAFCGSDYQGAAQTEVVRSRVVRAQRFAFPQCRAL